LQAIAAAGLLNDHRHRFLGSASWLKKVRKVAALAQLGDVQFDIAGAGLPKAITVAVAAVCPVWAFDIEAGAARAFDVELHHALGNEQDHLPEQISVCPFSTSSVNALVGLVIVVSGECLVFANSTLTKNHDDHPLSRRLWLVQLYHFLGHDQVVTQLGGLIGPWSDSCLAMRQAEEKDCISTRRCLAD